MTVDEMCVWMGYVKNGSAIPIQRCEDIIAALRAGEALAAASTNQVIEVLRECGFYTSANDLKRARDTWDAETKEDV